MMSSISNLEILPDEILMIIVKYCGNVYTILRSFSGLNQRLNNILIDKHLHLFTDLLCINNHHPDINSYYNSKSFRKICYQFLSLKIIEYDKHFNECLHSLIAFYIKEKFQQLSHEFQTKRIQFQSQRMNLTDTQRNNLDNQLEEIFDNLPDHLFPNNSSEPRVFSEAIHNIKQITSLILIEGASFKYDDSEEQKFGFNFSTVLNCWLLYRAHMTKYGDDHRFIDPIIEMFKALIISNPIFLKEITYAIDGRTTYPHNYLMYSIYELKYIKDRHFECRYYKVDIQWYKAEIDLFLFMIHCLNDLFIDEIWFHHCLWKLLDIIKLIVPSTYGQIFIQTSRLEILKIILHMYDQITIYNGYDFILSFLRELFRRNQLDMIRLFYEESQKIQYLLHRLDNTEKIINVMIENEKKKKLLKIYMNDEQLKTWLRSSDVLYLLLKKNQPKLIKYLLKLSPSLIHHVDQDRNDPLLYVCLKVHAHRHHLIKYFIQMGSNLYRTNSNDVNFFRAIQMKQNTKLFKKLIEHEIIQIDLISGQVKLTHSRRFSFQGCREGLKIVKRTEIFSKMPINYRSLEEKITELLTFFRNFWRILKIFGEF